jgi:hypothetical protein
LYLFEEMAGESVLESVQGEEFVPDVAIRLSVDGHGPVRHRGLEIVKARHQPFFRGRHDLAIIEPPVGKGTAGAYRGPVFELPPPRPGIVVSPNLSTKIFRYDAQRRTPPKADDRISTGIRELDLMLT